MTNTAAERIIAEAEREARKQAIKDRLQNWVQNAIHIEKLVEEPEMKPAEPMIVGSSENPTGRVTITLVIETGIAIDAKHTDHGWRIN